jgi:hypothetical protein
MTESQLIRIWRFVLIFGKWANFVRKTKRHRILAALQVGVVNNTINDPEKMERTMVWLRGNYYDPEKIKVKPPAN